jgi:hypothetical protein
MRSIGAAQYALDLMIQRVTDPRRKTFGKFLYQHGLPLILDFYLITDLICRYNRSGYCKVSG